jgi:sulfur carrier protein
MPEPTIQVRINQAIHELPQGASLVDAIAQVEIHPPFAAAVNLQFVPRQKYPQHLLHNGDQIELISPITGG